MSDYQQILGKIVAEEMKKMQSEDANFDPRGDAAKEVDAVTAEILKNMGGGSSNPAAHLPPELQKDVAWINQALVNNPLVIPYVAQHLDKVLENFKAQMHEMMKQAFDYEKAVGDHPARTSRPESDPTPVSRSTARPAPQPTARPAPDPPAPDPPRGGRR